MFQSESEGMVQYEVRTMARNPGDGTFSVDSQEFQEEHGFRYQHTGSARLNQPVFASQGTIADGGE